VQASFSKILKHLYWPLVVFTLLVFLALIKLGFWQSARADEKQLRIERMTELKTQGTISLKQVLDLAARQEEINDLPVVITGSFDQEKVFLLDNQPNNGQLGYRVLQVLKAGSHSVLVNLGWVLGSVDRQQLPTILPITGEHSISGHIRKVDLGIMLLAQDFTNVSWPLRVQQIELDKFSTLIDQPLLPFVVYLDKDEEIGYHKNWQPIVMLPEKHRAYAFQWFSLAIAWLALMVWALVKSYKNKENKA